MMRLQHGNAVVNKEKSRKPYEQIEQELNDALELISAIRNGDVDTLLSSSPRRSILLLERIEFVEERNRLLREIQDSNDTLLREIKTRKSVEKHLRFAIEKAEEAGRLKDTFVSLVSHDLRSPLGTIIGLFKFLLANSAGRLQDEDLDIVSRAIVTGDKMMKMVEDLLDLSRFRAGHLKPKFAFIDVYLVAVKALHNLSSLAESKGVSLKNRVPAKTVIYSDETMIYEVLFNIINNAIKFSRKHDTVTIHLSESHERVTVAVSDTGVGISKQKLEQIFKYRHNVSSPGTGGEVGSGLGLVLCKEIIEALNGTIRLESSVNIGSTFYVHLPEIHPVVLVIDNDHSAVMLVEKLFRRLDVNLVECQNGKEALVMAKKNPPHLILLDLQMDEMDGFEFLTLKQNDEAIKDIPTIVTTMFGDMANKEKALRLGADDFITKTQLQDELIPRAAKHIGYWPHFVPDIVAVKSERKIEHKRILLLEDDDTLRESLVEFFEDNGYSVMQAAKEEDAIKIYTDNFREIDVMVVDMRLPAVDGVNLAKYNFEHGYLPFILFTSLSDSKLAMQMLNFGVRDYLAKPVDYNEFLGVVNNAIARSHIIHGVDSTVKYPGNVESITIPAKISEIEKATDWIRRKIVHIGSQRQRLQFLGNVTEFILNAYEHGSLKITEEDKVELLKNGTFNEELKARESVCNEQIHIVLSVVKSDIGICIIDEGSGFDYNKYLNMDDETIVSRLDLPSGRGVNIAKRHFDIIEYSKSGASVLLTKKFL
jgi:signal transduction histidine kinase/YesN/AraC family two-component response regulator